MINLDCEWVIEEFYRVKRLPPYVFAEVNRLKSEVRASGADIVDLSMGNPDMATLGSKEGFADMAQAISAPGDVALVPNPTYSIHEFGFIIAGASIKYIPAGTCDDFFCAVQDACGMGCAATACDHVLLGADTRAVRSNGVG